MPKFISDNIQKRIEKGEEKSCLQNKPTVIASFVAQKLSKAKTCAITLNVKNNSFYGRLVNKSFSFFVIFCLLFAFIPSLNIHTSQALTAFEDSFETCDFSQWTSNTTSAGCVSEVTNENPYRGSYNAHFETNGTGVQDALISKTIDTTNMLYARGYFTINSITGSSLRGLIYFTGTAEIVRVGLTASNALVLRYANGTSILTDTSATTITTGVSHCLELYAKIDSTNGGFQVYLDGTELTDINQSGIATDNWGNITSVKFGISTAIGTAINLDIDSVKFDVSEYIGLESEIIATSLGVKGKFINSSIPSEGFEISVLALSNTTLSHYIIADNSTGLMTNGTQIDFAANQYSAMARKTGTLPANRTVLAWQAWIWDDNGNVVTTGIQTMKVYSISLTSVSIATINAANDACNANGGGSIILPAGNFTLNLLEEGSWDGIRYTGVVIDGGVNVFGAGDNQTILYTPINAWRSGGNTATYSQATYADRQFYLDGANGKSIRISGILFQGSVNFSSTMISYWGDNVNSYDGGLLLGIIEHGVTDYRIDHCTFLDHSNAAIYVETKMVTPSTVLSGNDGVIDHCIFDKPYKQIYWNETGYYPVWGYGVLVNAEGWLNHGWRTYDQLFGQYGPEMPIIETCSFQRCRHCISATGQGSDAYYVARYNNFTDNVRCYYNSFIDVHPGARGFEAYNNIFIDVTSDYRSISEAYWGAYMNRATTSDSGSGLFFNNTLYYCTEGVNLRDVSETNETWRVNGWWIWDNTVHDVTTPLKIVNGTTEPYTIVENDEYFLSAPTSEQLGFDYHALVYPLFEDQVFAEQTPLVDTYIVDVNIESPLNTTLTGPSIDVLLSTSGNSTISVRKINVDFSNGTSTGDIIITGPTQIIVNNNVSATLTAYVETLEGSTDTATVQFTVLNFVTYYVTLLDLKPANTTYTTSAIPFGAALSGNGTGSHYWGNIYNLTGAAYLYSSNLTSANVSLYIPTNGLYRADFWATNDEGATDSASVFFAIEIASSDGTGGISPTPTPTVTVQPTPTSMNGLLSVQGNLVNFGKTGNGTFTGTLNFIFTTQLTVTSVTFSSPLSSWVTLNQGLPKMYSAGNAQIGYTLIVPDYAKAGDYTGTMTVQGFDAYSQPFSVYIPYSLTVAGEGVDWLSGVNMYLVAVVAVVLVCVIMAAIAVKARR